MILFALLYALQGVFVHAQHAGLSLNKNINPQRIRSFQSNIVVHSFPQPDNMDVRVLNPGAGLLGFGNASQTGELQNASASSLNVYADNVFDLQYAKDYLSLNLRNFDQLFCGSISACVNNINTETVVPQNSLAVANLNITKTIALHADTAQINAYAFNNSSSSQRQSMSFGLSVEISLQKSYGTLMQTGFAEINLNSNFTFNNKKLALIQIWRC